MINLELVAHLKWLIYTIAFKAPFAVPRGAIHTQLYLNWVPDSLAVGGYAGLCQQGGNILQEADGAAAWQLDVWYAWFLSGRKHDST